MKEKNEEYILTSTDEAVAPSGLFAVSKIFARAKKHMTLSECKVFAYALSQVNWTEECPEVLYLDKKNAAKIAGVESDLHHLSQNLYRSIGTMPEHSLIKFADKDKDVYESGVFVTKVTMLKNRVRIKFEPEYLSLFGDLDKDYITMWSSDIFKMRSVRSVAFYEMLRLHSDTRVAVNTENFSLEQLKKMFDIPEKRKGSYVNAKTGHFDRNKFEKRVLDEIGLDLSETMMICLIRQPNGKYYEKVKKGNKVLYYKFSWAISMYPRVADAIETKEVREDVLKDPQTLKIAKDIVEGKKKPKKPTNKFHNFDQRGDDMYDRLEEVYYNR